MRHLFKKKLCRQFVVLMASTYRGGSNNAGLKSAIKFLNGTTKKKKINRSHRCEKKVTATQKTSVWSTIAYMLGLEVQSGALL